MGIPQNTGDTLKPEDFLDELLNLTGDVLERFKKCQISPQDLPPGMFHTGFRLLPASAPLTAINWCREQGVTVFYRDDYQVSHPLVLDVLCLNVLPAVIKFVNNLEMSKQSDIKDVQENEFYISISRSISYLSGYRITARTNPKMMKLYFDVSMEPLENLCYEALALRIKEGSPYDCTISCLKTCDVVGPGFSAAEFNEKLRRHDIYIPQVKKARNISKRNFTPDSMS